VSVVRPGFSARSRPAESILATDGREELYRTLTAGADAGE
jgi:hypothetical protein